MAAELKAREDEIRRREAAARAAKMKKIGLIAAIAAVLVFAAVMVITKVIIPSSKYNAAMEYLSTGMYAKAEAEFTALGNYKDSANRALQAEANHAFEAGQYKNALDIYDRLPA